MTPDARQAADPTSAIDTVVVSASPITPEDKLATIVESVDRDPQPRLAPMPTLLPRTPAPNAAPDAAGPARPEEATR